MFNVNKYYRALPAVLCAGLISWTAPRLAASTQYTGIALYPLMAPPGGTGVMTSGSAGGQTVGDYQVLAGDLTVPDALLWQADGTPIDLNSRGSSEANAIDGTKQVGYATPQVTNGFHATLWSGTAASAIDLHPANIPGFDQSVAYGVAGNQQVGYGYSNLSSPHYIAHALLWNGTAASFVDLHPTNLPAILSSLATATDGIHQVGWGETLPSTSNPEAHALLWSGTAASAVDLNPSGFVSSMAFGVGGGQQVGVATDANGHPGAFLWSGTAASAVSLGGGTAVGGSIAAATNGKQQVGQVGNQAVVWSGTAASVIDLPGVSFSFGGSMASSIDAAGDIFGCAGNYAMEWLTYTPLPGDANLDGKVDFTDLIALARHYGQIAGWVQGDFDQDGRTDFSDLVILARHYGQMLTLPAAGGEPSGQVPEPALLPIVSLLALLPRQRR